jgi:hypothetical protein
MFRPAFDLTSQKPLIDIVVGPKPWRPVAGTIGKHHKVIRADVAQRSQIITPMDEMGRAPDPDGRPVFIAAEPDEMDDL